MRVTEFYLVVVLFVVKYDYDCGFIVFFSHPCPMNGFHILCKLSPSFVFIGRGLMGPIVNTLEEDVSNDREMTR